jgi:hypothetical protein
MIHVNAWIACIISTLIQTNQTYCHAIYCYIAHHYTTSFMLQIAMQDQVMWEKTSHDIKVVQLCLQLLNLMYKDGLAHLNYHYGDI